MAKYYKISDSKSPNRQDSLFAFQRIYKSSYYARPFVTPGSKSELEKLVDTLGIKLDEEKIRKVYEEFHRLVEIELKSNRVTSAATYVFKTENSRRNVTLPSGLVQRGGSRIIYKPGSYLSRIFYRMNGPTDFTIFVGSGQGDINTLLEGGNVLRGGRGARFVSYSATIDQSLPNRQPYTVDKDRKVFMPYKGGARWVTLKAGRVVNPPTNRPVNTRAIWKIVTSNIKDGILKLTP